MLRFKYLKRKRFSTNEEAICVDEMWFADHNKDLFLRIKDHLMNVVVNVYNLKESMLNKLDFALKECGVLYGGLNIYQYLPSNIERQNSNSSS